MSARHPMVHLAQDPTALMDVLPTLRRIVMHDTAITEVGRSAGLTLGKQVFYVQTMDQKVQAILAGIGIGHVPKYRVQEYLQSGQILELDLGPNSNVSDVFLAWKISNKGKALKTLSQMLSAQKW